MYEARRPGFDNLKPAVNLWPTSSNKHQLDAKGVEQYEIVSQRLKLFVF